MASYIGRRKFLATLGGAAAAWPIAARAEQAGNKRTIGYLSPATSPATPAFTALGAAFSNSLRNLGWIEGQNIFIERRYAENRLERLPELAAELVRLNVEVIVATGTLGPLAAKRATSIIPIVMTAAGDPLASGLVANPYPAIVFKETEAAARSLGIEVQSLEVRSPDDFNRAFEKARRQRPDALIEVEDPLTNSLHKRIVEFAAAERLPSLHGIREEVEAGGLISYGASLPDLFRRAAGYVDKILKGAKPADLPVEQPTRFELVINLKTARVLGLEIPATVLARADEVIE
jgi:putative ABC transport system substrate-binding protein